MSDSRDSSLQDKPSQGNPGQDTAGQGSRGHNKPHHGEVQHDNLHHGNLHHDNLHHDKGPLLGRQIAPGNHYDPGLLFPVPRANARSGLPAGYFRAYGEDLWHAYELSWLTSSGKPAMHLGRITVPANSVSVIESKSLKLYLNSLNSERFASDELAIATIERDLSKVAEGEVRLQLLPIEAAEFAATQLEGECLDSLEVAVPETPSADLLKAQPRDAKHYTHLMRSLCPVTAQPDWATVLIETRGQAPEPEGLLAYLLAYRNHQEFHEQCVERIFGDLWSALSPDYLSVQALYTRRGGLDICPWRCSENLPAPRRRLNRQ